jgi:predicted nucleotidyltransferase
MATLGIAQENLQPKPREAFEKKFNNPEYQMKAFEHFEERRVMMINEITEKRNEIMNTRERVRDPNQNTVQRSSLRDETSSLIEREKRQMENLKKKQQKEIEQLMEHELKMQVGLDDKRKFGI